MLKFKKGKFRTITLEYHEWNIVIGPDSGTHGRKEYWYFEVNNKVIMHGFSRRKDAIEYANEYFKNKIKLFWR